jgi:hypothetical protein
MNLQAIPRTLISSSLRLIRLPVDGALRLGGSSTNGARLAVDRLDAGVRGAAGVLLRDDTLTKDSFRRRYAADERQHAFRLRAEAEFREGRGEREVEQAGAEGDARRRQADKAASQRRNRAKKQRDAKKSNASKRASSRQQAVQKAARARKQLVAEGSKRDRLEAVKSKSEALDEKAGALATSAESTRLQKAASGAKARRKNGGAG